MKQLSNRIHQKSLFYIHTVLCDKNILATYGHHKRWKQRYSLTDHVYTDTQPDTKPIKAISLDFSYELFDVYAVRRPDTKVTIKASNTTELIY